MVQAQAQQNAQSFPPQAQPVTMPTKVLKPQVQQTGPLTTTSNLATVRGAFQMPEQTLQTGVEANPIINCLIPGCQQTAHIDPASGQVGNYCSMQHREYVRCSAFPDDILLMNFSCFTL